MKSIKPTIDGDKKIVAPSKTFLRRLDFMIGKNRVFYDHLLNTGNINTMAKMYRRDSTKRLPIKTASVDLVISSPPYVTSYEYADLHQLSLLWFGDDPTHFRRWSRLTCNFDSFRKTFMGTNCRQGRESNLGSTIADRTVDELSAVDKSTALAAANYFMDMRRAFAEMYRMLKPGAKACIIIGNTSLCGVRILNAEVATEQMNSIGLNKVDFIKREVPNKMITPWRDIQSGKFTGLSNPNKTRAYECEFIIVMQKTSN
jgi:DNA modification methylase